MLWDFFSEKNNEGKGIETLGDRSTRLKRASRSFIECFVYHTRSSAMRVYFLDRHELWVGEIGSICAIEENNPLQYIREKKSFDAIFQIAY